jgi:CheY-like chemotaxis protein
MNPLRVLVVDDNQDAADSLALLLKMLGEEACAAYDGPTALKLACVFRPEVALLDLDLGCDMDGCEVARQLRKHVRLLVAVTGSARQEDRLLCDEAGFDFFLLKPFDLAEVQRLLAGTRAATARRLAV